MAELDEIIAIEINNFRVGSGRGEKSFSFLFVLRLSCRKLEGRLQTSAMTQMKSSMPGFLLGFFSLARIVNRSVWNHLFCHNVCFV